jgi:hypothetical protein
MSEEPRKKFRKSLQEASHPSWDFLAYPEQHNPLQTGDWGSPQHAGEVAEPGLWVRLARVVFASYCSIRKLYTRLRCTGEPQLAAQHGDAADFLAPHAHDPHLHQPLLQDTEHAQQQAADQGAQEAPAFQAWDAAPDHILAAAEQQQRDDNDQDEVLQTFCMTIQTLRTQLV